MSTRIFVPLLLAAVLFVAPACTSSGNAVTFADFAINFTGFGLHVGQNFYLKVKDAGTGATVGTVPVYAVTAASFNLGIPDIIQEGVAYNIDFFADMDASGAVPDLSPTGTPVGVDHTWRIAATGTPTGLTITFPHDAIWTDITPF